jgi:hypothetical protein
MHSPDQMPRTVQRLALRREVRSKVQSFEQTKMAVAVFTLQTERWNELPSVNGHLIMERNIKGNKNVYMSEGRNKLSHDELLYTLSNSQEINNFTTRIERQLI